MVEEASVVIAPWRRIVALSLRVAVLLLASYVMLAGVAKLSDLSTFKDVLATHGLVAKGWLGPVALTTALAEVVISAASLLATVLSPKGWRLGSILHAWLFASLCAYASAVAMNPPARPASCGCQGSRRLVIDWRTESARHAGIVMVLALAPVLGRALDRRRVASTHESDLVAQHAVLRP